MSRFGEVIRQARQWLKVNQQWLADQSGIVQSMVAMIEGGSREPTIPIAIKMVEALVGNALGGKVTRIALVGSTRDGRPQFEVEWEREGSGYKQRITSPRPLIETLAIGEILGISQRTELLLLAEVLTLAMEGAKAREGSPKAMEDTA